MIRATVTMPRAEPMQLSDFETSPFRSIGEVSKALLKTLSVENQPSLIAGTDAAINYPTIGGAADSAEEADEAATARQECASQAAKRPSGRGGARNRADRESHDLSAAQIGNLKAAERHAKKIGLPFTRMITIHWEAAGVPLEGMAKATGRFTDLMTKALARHGSGTAWLWVHENGDGKGGHCHLLAHVPAELVPIVNRLRLGWLNSITGRTYKKGVICSKPIGRLLELEVSNPDLHAVNLLKAFGYCLKQTEPEVASQFGLERLEPGGRIIGKRCGTSQNIGPKARNIALMRDTA